MGLILVPGREQSANTPFLDLVRDEAELAAVFNAILQIVARSFRDDAARCGVEYAKRVQTEAEMKRRADISGKWYRVMRGDLHWSKQRILDELPRALRVELDGGSYTPPERSCWAAGGQN